MVDNSRWKRTLRTIASSPDQILTVQAVLAAGGHEAGTMLGALATSALRSQREGPSTSVSVPSESMARLTAIGPDRQQALLEEMSTDQVIDATFTGRKDNRVIVDLNINLIEERTKGLAEIEVTPYGTYEMICEALARDPNALSKGALARELRDIKTAIRAGATPEELSRAAWNMNQDHYWSQRGITMSDVVRHLPRYAIHTGHRAPTGGDARVRGAIMNSGGSGRLVQ